MYLPPHTNDAASEYSNRLSSFVMPPGARRIKISKSAVFRHRPKGKSSDGDEFRGVDLLKYLALCGRKDLAVASFEAMKRKGEDT